MGDQLIRDPAIAVFELVKNAYDADASQVRVTMSDVSTPEDGTIVVEDNGSGMTFETVTGVWLEPGTDNRQRQREAKEARTSKFHRLPLGEKGVGRFAVDKLGNKLTLITRHLRAAEVVVTINWDELSEMEYLADALVTVEEREPQTFRGRSGTRIEISSLRQSWDRKTVRALRRSMTSICSPFSGPDDFETYLDVVPDQGWLANMADAGEIMDLALFRAKGTMSGAQLEFEYIFRPLTGMKRVHSRTDRYTYALQRPERSSEGVALDLADYRIGEVDFEILVFDREPRTLALGVSDKAGLKEFLDQNGGVRVYREGIRVYDYGEPGNDWLELDAKRVNVPSRRISNNIVIGAISLSLDSSQDLVEKTNREGFVESAASIAFRDAVSFAVQQVVVERNKDKDRIRSAYDSSKQRQPVLDALDDLRTTLAARNVLNEVAPQLNAVERDYVEMRDQLLTAAGAGLNLSMVVHEVEKAIADLRRALDRNASLDRVKALAQHLSEIVTGLTYLTRRSGSKTESAADLVRHSLFNVEYRIRHHGIALTNNFLQGNDFKMKCVRRLVIASVMNIVDNSIWWLDVGNPKTKRIWIGPSTDFDGPAILIVDNGPGFSDPEDVLTQPFMSRRTDGMGLGLHLTSEVMKAQGGRIEFVPAGDSRRPKGFNGAAVALVFAG